MDLTGPELFLQHQLPLGPWKTICMSGTDALPLRLGALTGTSSTGQGMSPWNTSKVSSHETGYGRHCQMTPRIKVNKMCSGCFRFSYTFVFLACSHLKVNKYRHVFFFVNLLQTHENWALSAKLCRDDLKSCCEIALRPLHSEKRNLNPCYVSYDCTFRLKLLSIIIFFRTGLIF